MEPLLCATAAPAHEFAEHELGALITRTRPILSTATRVVHTGRFGGRHRIPKLHCTSGQRGNFMLIALPNEDAGFHRDLVPGQPARSASKV